MACSTVTDQKETTSLEMEDNDTSCRRTASRGGSSSLPRIIPSQEGI